jgi:hypothetical protein
MTGKLVFRHKFHVDGSLESYKARMVCWGFTQLPGIDYDEMFNPVVKSASVCIVLSLVDQLDIKNTFLHDTLSEVIYFY